MGESLDVILMLLGGVGFVALILRPFVVVWRRRQSRVRAREAGSGGFPMDFAPSGPRRAIAIEDGGPGRYRIVGVVASTGTDTKMDIEAESLANAKVKAELRGVVVTDIIKL